jgi:glutamate carboxypeptidase
LTVAVTRPAGAAEAALEVARWLAPRRDEMVGFVRDLVELESPSGDLASLACVAEFLRAHLRAVVREEEVRETPHGQHVVARAGVVDGRGPLVLCHYDTVWPLGTTRERPFARDGEHLTGPGVLDMKAGVAMAVFALRAIEELWGFATPVTLSLTPDEEIGNPSTRAAVEALAAEASAVFVLEPPLPGGALKTRRKGIANVRVAVEGVAAHAGLDPDAGASAALEVAHRALAASRLADRARGTTVNVGTLRAGTARNVVAAAGELSIDVRAWEEAELERVLAGLAAAEPSVERTRTTVEGRIHRPPMVRDPRIEPLVAAAREIAAALGTTLDEGEAGGGSEANFTSLLAPTLDGLGPEGGGAHALDERVVLTSLFDRTALLAALLAA